MAGDHAAKVAEVARGYGLDYPLLLMGRDSQSAREFGSVKRGRLSIVRWDLYP